MGRHRHPGRITRAGCQAAAWVGCPESQEVITVNVHEQQGCLGYFGFGGGHVMASEGHRTSVCDECPLKEPCWDLHKKRTEELFPAAVAAFEEMAKRLRGPALMKAWFAKAGNADPYTVVMGGNLEDGMSVVNAGRVMGRGPYTLPYPFKQPNDSGVQTWWNGELAPCRKVLALIADDPSFPHYWAREEGLVGQEIPAVEVSYAGHVFYLDDRTGSAWRKVTIGKGSPQYGHASITPAAVRERPPTQ